MTYLYSKKWKNTKESSSSGNSDDSVDTLIGSASTISFDRSSTGSLPWAEDAIKQNQQEWEKIERMFYGDEPLPDDENIREEILEWIKVFPHFHVTGKKMNIHYDPNLEADNENYEEIFAIDPIPKHMEHYSLTRNSLKPIKKEIHVHANDLELSKQIKNYLKITPTTIGYRTPNVNISKTGPYFLKIPTESCIRLINIRDPMLTVSKTTNQKPTHNSLNNKNNVRMPPIYSINIYPSATSRTNVQNQLATQQYMTKSASYDQFRNRLQLPAIDEKAYTTPMRGINALNKQKNNLFCDSTQTDSTSQLRSISAFVNKTKDDEFDNRTTSNIKIIKF